MGGHIVQFNQRIDAGRVLSKSRCRLLRQQQHEGNMPSSSCLVTNVKVWLCIYVVREGGVDISTHYQLSHIKCSERTETTAWAAWMAS